MSAAWELMKCGNCGCDTARITAKGKDRHEFTELMLTCTGCLSSTKISIPQPAMAANWPPAARAKELGLVRGGDR